MLGVKIAMKLHEMVEKRRKDVLLSAFYLFSRLCKEVSLSEIQDSIAEFQQKSTLGYSFSEHFRYSFDLMTDLKDLVHSGFVHEYNYRHDAFLPKRYFALTPLGIGRGKKMVSMIPPDELEDLETAVTTAIKNHKQRWHLWSRYE